MFGRLACGVALVLCARVAVADSPHPASAEEAAAAHKACDAVDDVADLEECGRRYLEIANRYLDSDDRDKILYQAGIMFTRARSVGAAINVFGELMRSFPYSPLAAKALASRARLFEDIAMYDRAAELLEQYASRYAGEKDAYAAMSDAVFFRRGIGDDEKAIEDTKIFIKMFGARRPDDAANAAFSMTAIYEKRRDADAVVKWLREYIRTWGARGGEDRLVIAYGKLGQALWERSCPAQTIDGACVRVARASPAVARCADAAPTTTAKFTSVVRDPQLRKDALVAFSGAIKAFEKAGGKTGGDEASARYYYAAAKLSAVDDDLDGLFDASVPTDKKFAAWVDEQVARRQKLVERYEQIFEAKDAATSIAAASRIARLEESFAEALTSSPLPGALKTGKERDRRIKAHCDELESIAAPFRHAALMAHATCLARSTELGWFDDASRSCERGAMRLAPEEFPPLRERVTAASFAATIVTSEPPPH